MKGFLIHFFGYLVVNALYPDWIEEAGGGFLAVWYLNFALIDLIATIFTEDRKMLVMLSLSCAWSAGLAIEVIYLHDLLQSKDYIAQWFLDAGFTALLLRWVWGKYSKRKAQTMKSASLKC